MRLWNWPMPSQIAMTYFLLAPVVGAFLRPSSVSWKRGSLDHKVWSGSQLQATVTSQEDRWIRHGLLLSSFSEGLRENPKAEDFLMRGLVEALARERQSSSESQIESSARYSPCCGPDLDAMMMMESADRAIVELQENKKWTKALASLTRFDNLQDHALELRVMYIPTALYALRSESQASPGRQRQRARADGKKRRDDIMEWLAGRLEAKVQLSAVTFDLDDASLKHAQGSINPALLDGKTIFENWKPHLVYVEGGNTFWLHHCVEKGNWSQVISEVCSSESTVYCGSSAGAIIMGSSLETACWKQWDDPSVVAGKQSFDDWKGVQGLGMVGDVSIFPHMEQYWDPVVNEQEHLNVLCLRDSEVCCVDGNTRTYWVHGQG